MIHKVFLTKYLLILDNVSPTYNPPFDKPSSHTHAFKTPSFTLLSCTFLKYCVLPYTPCYYYDTVGIESESRKIKQDNFSFELIRRKVSNVTQLSFFFSFPRVNGGRYVRGIPLTEERGKYKKMKNNTL